ncbi:hypothetical protein ACVWWG_008159 [Bradyrhizobium sp. LB7.2]
MLRADDEVAARSEDVGEEAVLRVLDGVAVVDHGDRHRDHAGIGLHFLVATDRDIDRHGAVVARGVVEGDGLVFDRPLARREIGDAAEGTDRNQNGNSTLHFRPQPQARAA